MKRTLARFLALLMALSLVGCGGGNAPLLTTEGMPQLPLEEDNASVELLQPKTAEELAEAPMAAERSSNQIELLATSATTENTNEFLGGDGTEDDPFLISSAVQLNNVRNHLDAHFELVADIQFFALDFAEGGNFYNSGNGWAPLGDNNTPFSGTFKGNSHTISGLTVNNATYAGLFGIIDGGEVEGLNIADANISGLGYAAALVGSCENARISHCNTSGNIYSNNTSAYATDCIAYAAGVSGYGMLSEFSRCTSSCTVDAYALTTYAKKYGTTTTYTDTYVGGIVGYSNSCTISQSTNSASSILRGEAKENPNLGYPYTYFTNHIGGIAGGAISTQIQGCANFADIDKCPVTHGLDDAGGIVGEALRNENTNTMTTIDQCYNTGYISADSCGGIVGFGGSEHQSAVSNCYNAGSIKGTRAGGISGNYGRVSCCYNVGLVMGTTVGGIRSTYDNIHKDISRIDDCYYASVLPYDTIDAETATGVSLAEMSNIQRYSGFDFENIWMIDQNGEYPFPTLRNNRHVEKEGSSDFQAGNGTIYNPYQISNEAQLRKAGGAVSASYRIISDLVLPATWTPIDGFEGYLDGGGHSVSGMKIDVSGADANFFGMFRDNNGVICNIRLLDCSINVSYEGTDTLYVGGIAGRSSGTITGCTVSGSIRTSASSTNSIYCGGIAGKAALVCQCKNTASVTADRSPNGSLYAGGIAADAQTITQCSNTGEINAEVSMYSGAVTTASSLNGYSYAGGIAVDAQTITQCSNTGEINAKVSMDSEKKPITAYAYAAGIAHECQAVSDCYNAGNIWVDLNARAWGSTVSMAATPCGIVYTAQDVKNCYNIGVGSGTIYTVVLNGSTSTGTPYFFPVFYDASQNAEGCFYLAATNTKDSADQCSFHAVECSAADMQLEETFSGYQFGTIWGIDVFSTYPYPQFAEQMSEIQSLTLLGECPAQLTTIEGMYPSLSGLKAEAVYADGSTGTATVNVDMIPDFDPDIIGAQLVPLRYRGVSSQDCMSITVFEKSPVKLEILTYPTKVRYYLGEDFDSSGGTVKVSFDNETSIVLNLTDDMVSGFDSSTLGSETLSVTYEGVSAEFIISIFECSSIEMATLPDKLCYIQGQPLDTTGAKIRAYFTDGESEYIDLEQNSCTFSDSDVGVVPVTVSYFGKSTEFSITVNDRIVNSIYLASAPSKLVYVTGEDLNLTGSQLRVDFVSEDGYYELMELTTDMVSGYDTAVVGIQTVTVTYEGKHTSFVVRTSKSCSVNVSVDGTTLTYTAENVPAGAMMIMAQYDNGQMTDAQLLIFKDGGNKSGNCTMKGCGNTYKLMLVDAISYSPICAAWCSLE